MAGNAGEPKFQKLKIQGYKDAKFNKRVDNVEEFVAMINPSSIRRKMSINIKTEPPPPGNNNSTGNFQSINPETLSFQLIVDGTGVIDPAPGQDKTVKQHIDHFIKLTFDYQGEIHEPYYLSLSWGEFMFKGRLTSCDINYTLFDPGGNPLRAKLDLTFTSTQDLETQAKVRKTSSPDLSHILEVKEGDTLPLMCSRIYRDSSMYVKVARINNLVNFRNLVPGTMLLFPPIK